MPLKLSAPQKVYIHLYMPITKDINLHIVRLIDPQPHSISRPLKVFILLKSVDEQRGVQLPR